MWFLVRMVFWLTFVSILLGRAPLSWIGGTEGTASLSDKRVLPSQSTLTPADLAATWRDPVRARELLREMQIARGLPSQRRDYVEWNGQYSTECSAPKSGKHAAYAVLS